MWRQRRVEFESTAHYYPKRGAGEDRVAILPMPHQGRSSVFMAIADGAGGRPGGARAAEVAVDIAVEKCRSNGLPKNETACCKLIRQIDETVAEDEEAGESTLIVAVVTPSQVYGASIGDSEAWLIAPTHDLHLTAGERLKPYLGHGCCTPQPFRTRLCDGTVLLATDGLWKYADRWDIVDAVLSRDMPLDDIATSLVALAKGGRVTLPDDVGIALVRPILLPRG